jgi:hypothetical protein
VPMNSVRNFPMLGMLNRRLSPFQQNVEKRCLAPFQH